MTIAPQGRHDAVHPHGLPVALRLWLDACESDAARTAIIAPNSRLRRRLLHGERGRGVGARLESERRATLVRPHPSTFVNARARNRPAERLRVSACSQHAFWTTPAGSKNSRQAHATDGGGDDEGASRLLPPLACTTGRPGSRSRDATGLSRLSRGAWQEKRESQNAGAWALSTDGNACRRRIAFSLFFRQKPRASVAPASVEKARARLSGLLFVWRMAFVH